MSRRLAADAVSEHIDLPDLQMGKEPDDVGGQVGGLQGTPVSTNLGGAPIRVPAPGFRQPSRSVSRTQGYRSRQALPLP